ncbi:polysaccharide pyruvyl transferase family protein [Leuconostoc gelidum subsp. gasicomitatum]|uniref:polysaccharide pyruvyl transferase family protein n=1 Tax=Leuconostoc gelidum group TaxID=3016637 RepID=UPI001CC69C1F|nr:MULTISPECIES: polysaccharide pyruvyl transferase family protein [Leuconostoc gelidum group]MBZ5964362.1 polysaccharide pyruvyl transferase family protein [Leuconostoc gelidum subsp. gelidum]MBZ5996179.1 polysaccharide pyruvyl transferase family protein [Leuconostoc gasicomitatum]
MNIAVDAYLDNNLGDDLMIKLFANYFSEHEIYIFKNETIVKKSFEDLPNITFFEPQQYKELLNIIDLHVTIGGSMFILDSFKKWVRFRHRIRNAKILKRRGIKSAVIGSNLGPFDKNNIGLFLSKWELKYKDLITVRDRMSYDLLIDEKVKSPVKLFPDIVFSQLSEKKTATYSLGVSVYRSKDPKYDNFLNYENLTTVVDQHIKNFGGKVALFAFDSEDENDLVAAYYIKELSQYKKNIEIIPYLNNSDYFIEEFSKCEKILGIRFHSSVLALRLGIPLFSIYYSNKTINLMKDLKLQKFAISLSEFDSKKKQIEININNNNLAMLSLDKRQQILNKSLGHFKEVEKLMNQIIIER